MGRRQAQGIGVKPWKTAQRTNDSEAEASESFVLCAYLEGVLLESQIQVSVEHLLIAVALLSLSIKV